jgi:hypothetical protein
MDRKALELFRVLTRNGFRDKRDTENRHKKVTLSFTVQTNLLKVTSQQLEKGNTHKKEGEPNGGHGGERPSDTEPSHHSMCVPQLARGAASLVKKYDKLSSETILSKSKATNVWNVDSL